MPHEDVVRFEAAAGDLLAELGYPRAAPSAPPQTLEPAARIRQAFAEQVRACQRPLPGSWSNDASASLPAPVLGA